MDLSNTKLDHNKLMDDSGCVQDELMAECSKEPRGLMDLSDDVLLYILQFCSPRDLKALGYTCPRLGILICDRSLWTSVDAREEPIGVERMRWLLDHCLSSATQELKLKGHVDKDIRCVGVQDLSYYDQDTGMLGDMGTWYPHLPRFAMSPRWPDKREAIARNTRKFKKPKLYPLTQLPSLIAAGLHPDPFADDSDGEDLFDPIDSGNNVSKANNIASNSSAAVSNSELPSNNSEVPSNISELPSTSNVSSNKKDISDELSSTTNSDLLNDSKLEEDSSKPCTIAENLINNDSNPSDLASNSKSEKRDASTKPRPILDKLLISASTSKNTSSSNNLDNTASSNSVSSTNNSPLNRNHESKVLDMDSPSSKWSMSASDGSVVDDFEDPAKSKCSGPKFTLDEVILRKLKRKCSNLTSLALEYCNLDYRTTSLSHFPPGLKKLSLKGTRCFNLPLNTSFLGKIQDKLPALEYLDISECEWFEPASLMSLSKLPALEVLYMKECKRLTECVAYASLATRYGFQKLKVLDVRGSMVADSEVSAFGWLPVLEELYVSPPGLYKKTIEHAHKWEEVLNPPSELEKWEIDEPEYHKNKSSPEEMEEDEDLKEGVGIWDERFGDLLFGDYLNYPSIESRIIVIQPNRNRDGVEEVGPEALRPPAPVPPAGEPPAAEAPTAQPPTKPLIAEPSAANPPAAEPSAQDPPCAAPPTVDQAVVKKSAASSSDMDAENPGESQAGPSRHQEPKLDSPGPSKRACDDDSTSKLTKRPRLVKRRNRKRDKKIGDDDSDISSSDEEDRELCNRALVNVLKLIKSQTSGNELQIQTIKHPSRTRPSGKNSGDSRPRNSPPHRSQNQSRLNQNIPQNQNLPQERNIPQNRNEYVRIRNRMPFGLQPQPDNDQNPLRTLAFEISRAQARHEHPIVLPIPPNPFCIPEPLNYQELLQQAGPEPNENQPDNSSNENPGPNNQDRPPENRHPILGALIPHAAQPLVQLNIDLERESVSQTFPLFGYHLVTDSAVLRFGRADNETINYVHIGHFEPNERGVRPDRSSLRVLSITGFRSITNRSLEHLATAAPHLRLIDFSNTGVTSLGVALFKVVRPDCEVIFSQFRRSM